MRILLTKIGLDGHDVGIKVLARAARDARHEVVYLGIRQSPQMIAAAARDEGVDVIAVSILSGAHHTLLADLCAALSDAGVDIPVVAGGLVPDADRMALEAVGVADVVPSGVTASEAIARIASVGERSGHGS